MAVRIPAIAHARLKLRRPRQFRPVARPSSAPTSKTTLIAFLFIAATSIWAYFRWKATAVVLDDAYIGFRYARNLVEGHGLVFNPGERVEGYTNFLWVLISAGGLEAGIDPLVVARVVGVASYVLCVAGCGVLMWRDIGGRPALLPVLLLLPTLVLPYGLAAMAGSGLETCLAAAFMLLVGVLGHFVTLAPAREPLVGVVGLAAILTRPDAGLAVAASVVVSVVDAMRRRLGLGATVAALARRWWPTVIGTCLYVGWKLWYYGAILPNTYYAKAADQWQLGPGARYVAGFLVNSPQVIVLALAALAALLFHRQYPRRQWLLFCCVLGVAWVGFVVKVGGDFMYYRFMFEAYPVMVLAAVPGIVWGLERRPVLTVCLLVAVLALSTTRPRLERRYGMQSLREMQSYVTTGLRVGRALARMPSDTVISTTLAGTIPYASRLETIDEWGLNDATVARQPYRGFNRRGHQKRASVSYLASRGVTIALGHPVVCSCSDPCVDGGASVFIRLDDTDECVRARVIWPSASLLQQMCREPDRYMFSGLSCP